MLDAVVVSFAATALMRWLRGSHPSYTYSVPDRAVVLTATRLVLPLFAATVLVGLVTGRVFRWARGHDPTGRVLVLTVGAACLATGVLSVWQPQVPGNGRTIMQLLLVSTPGLGTLLGLAFAKLLATTLALRGGVAGGMLTPALAIGAATGAAVAQLTHSPDLAVSAACALIGAAGVLALCEDAPAFGITFALELAHAPVQLALPASASVVPAWLAARAVSRRWGRPSRPDVKAPPPR